MDKITVDINWLLEYDDAERTILRCKKAFEYAGELERWDDFQKKATMDNGEYLFLAILDHFYMVNTRANVLR